jgi:glucose-1-phosphate cytidylyltransferase
VHGGSVEPWRVTLVDTGEATQTGGRLKRVAPYVGDGTFLMTYGDGVADVDLGALVEFHRAHGKLATVTAVQPLGRFGAMELAPDDESVLAFREKPKGDGAWVNGGFFVLEPGVLARIGGDATLFEQEPLEQLAADGQLRAFKHMGFWQPMDVLRDKTHLDQLWRSGKAPWKVW